MQTQNVESMTTAQMQSIVRENGLKVNGDKRRRDVLEGVVSKFLYLQAEAIALAVDTKLAAESSVAESVAVADATETVAVLAVEKAVEVLTRPDVVSALTLALRIVAVSIAFLCFSAYKVAGWCWERRAETAVYHWIVDGTAWVRAQDWDARRWMAIEVQ
jgi:hypothetical protein